MPKKTFRLTSPTPYIPKEYEDQVTVFAWAKYCKLDGIEWLFATLNGVRLPIGLARKMKRAGLKPGPPDLYLDVKRHGFSGLRIEEKRGKGGVLSDDQKAWHQHLREEGFKVMVTRGANETIAAIKEYLDD